jgi:sulfoacetaldehyde dehydrogenase
VLLDSAEKAQLQRFMFPEGKLSAAATAQSAEVIASRAGLACNPKFLMVQESGAGPELSVLRREAFSGARGVPGQRTSMKRSA